MGLISSFKDAFKRGRSGESKPDAPSARRPNRVRNPPGVEDRGSRQRQGNRSQQQRGQEPGRERPPERFDQEPGGGLDPDDDFRQGPGPSEDFGPRGGPGGGPGNEFDEFDDRNDVNDFDRELEDMNRDVGPDMAPEPGASGRRPQGRGDRRSGQRGGMDDFEAGRGPQGSQQAMRTQQRGRGGGGRDEEAPRHYNFDLPVDADDEGEIIEAELQQIADQNDRIIELLRRIQSDISREY